jgi:NAD(P)H-flavin reductase
MQTGNEAELIGPLGNCWSDFIKGGERPLALIGGGIGIAPLVALAQELRDSFPYDFYAGFKSVSPKLSELLTALLPRLIIATEDGMEGGGRKGRIPDFLNPAAYRAVFACGPAAMLTAVTAQCQSVPCFVSTERRMACGVGACLGCAIETRGGYKHCCSDGPIFNAEELVFES